MQSSGPGITAMPTILGRTVLLQMITFLGQHLFLLEADPTPGGPVIHPCLALGSE